MNLTGVTRHLNGTILMDSEDAKAKVVIFEDKLFKIALLSVALCVLTVTGIIICILYRRKNKLAYVSTATCEVTEEPVELTHTKTMHSLCNKFSRQELKDNECIYYIFSNPIPVVPEDDTASHKVSTCTLKEYAKNDIPLNPPIFYLQVSNFL